MRRHVRALLGKGSRNQTIPQLFVEAWFQQAVWDGLSEGGSGISQMHHKTEKRGETYFTFISCL